MNLKGLDIAMNLKEDVSLKEEWCDYYRNLGAYIDAIRQEHPPYKYAPDVWTDTYFDGSVGRMHKVEFWKYPAEDIITELLIKEQNKSSYQLRQETEKAYSEPCDCKGRGFGEE